MKRHRFSRGRVEGAVGGVRAQKGMRIIYNYLAFAPGLARTCGTPRFSSSVTSLPHVRSSFWGAFASHAVFWSHSWARGAVDPWSLAVRNQFATLLAMAAFCIITVLSINVFLKR